MKRIKLCWSIARIINAHQHTTNTCIKLIIKALKSICCWLAKIGTCARGPKLLGPSLVSDSAAGVVYQFLHPSRPHSFPSVHHFVSPYLFATETLRAIKRWFPAFCLQFLATSFYIQKVRGVPFNIILMCVCRVCVCVCMFLCVCFRLHSNRFECVCCESRLNRLTARFIVFIGFIGFVCPFFIFYFFKAICGQNF